MSQYLQYWYFLASIKVIHYRLSIIEVSVESQYNCGRTYQAAKI